MNSINVCLRKASPGKFKYKNLDFNLNYLSKRTVREKNDQGRLRIFSFASSCLASKRANLAFVSSKFIAVVPKTIKKNHAANNKAEADLFQGRLSPVSEGWIIYFN